MWASLLLLLLALVSAPRAYARHHDCDWDILGEHHTPEEAGFELLCETVPTRTVSGRPPFAYYCNVEGGNGPRQYIVAGWGTLDGELEFGKLRKPVAVDVFTWS